LANRPITATPGASYNSPLDFVAQLESGDSNIPQNIHDINTDKGTPAGGNFQIIDPTWRTYAPKAGINLSQYPTAMSAPRSVQAQVASAIPFNQWGPRTVAAVTARYPWIDTHQTLGAIQAKALALGATASPAGSDAGRSGAPIAAVGQVQAPQTAAPPSMGSMIGQALGSMASPGLGGGSNTAALAQAAPAAPGPQMAFRAAADDAAQASNLTAGGPPGAGAAGQPGAGPGGMTGLLGLMQDPTAQTQLQLPTDTPMVGMSGLLYGGGAGLGVRHPAVTRLT
jgi:hypothetical protein